MSTCPPIHLEGHTRLLAHRLTHTPTSWRTWAAPAALGAHEECSQHFPPPAPTSGRRRRQSEEGGQEAAGWINPRGGLSGRQPEGLNLDCVFAESLGQARLGGLPFGKSLSCRAFWKRRPSALQTCTAPSLWVSCGCQRVATLRGMPGDSSQPSAAQAFLHTCPFISGHAE